MATVKAFIRTTKTGKDKPVNVRFRVSDGRLNNGGIQLFHKSEFSILPTQWDEKQQKIKARILFDEQERKNFDKAIADRKDLIKTLYLKFGKSLTSDKLDTEIDKCLYPENYQQPRKTFFETFEDFLQKHQLSDVRRRDYRVLLRELQRFEFYTQKHVRGQKNFKLDIDTFTPDTLTAFDDFLYKEHLYYSQYPEIYSEFPDYRQNIPRGTNTVAVAFSKLRAFFNWCNNNDLTINKPFAKYKSPAELYGTPYYLTIEERNQLYSFDFSDRPALQKQRNIFVFQCLVGCRVGDLYNLKKENVINGAIEYVASKTKDEKPKTIRVPLNTIAAEILALYADLEGEQLLPLISQQKYNEAIKECFTFAGITRSVTILNPLTRKSEIRPLNEVASSHLARRTFCGNLYKKVKDPNLVGSLSGHAEGSKAFARYREIDEDMKRELVSMIE